MSIVGSVPGREMARDFYSHVLLNQSVAILSAPFPCSVRVHSVHCGSARCRSIATPFEDN